MSIIYIFAIILKFIIMLFQFWMIYYISLNGFYVYLFYVLNRNYPIVKTIILTLLGKKNDTVNKPK